MGYIVTAIAVELSKVSDALSSKDKQLVGALVQKFEDEFEQFDEMAADVADDEEGEEPLRMRDALTQMVMGQEYSENFGFIYGYALEFLCRHFGEFLPNREWSAMPSGSDWAETVDEGLNAAGVAESVLRVGMHLMNRGAPIAIPDIDDFPAIGYLRLDEIKAAKTALEEAKVTDIKDKQVLASIQELQSWMHRCAESGRDMVCFYA